MFPVRIAGLGWSLPELRVSSAELERRMELPAGWIGKATGVEERRYATSETTVSMAADAARMALRRAEVEPESIDYVVGACSGPQQCIPCTAVFVQRELGLPEGRSFCFDVNATCLSFLVAFHQASQAIAAGCASRVLIFSSEIGNYMRDFEEPESSVLLGDGAAAAVLTRSQPGDSAAVHGALFETHSSGADLTACQGGGTLHHPNDPNTRPEMNRFHMNGRAVFRMALKLVGPFMDRCLQQLAWTRDDINLVVPHQASGPGIALVEQLCGFRREQVFSNVRVRGNCVAASIPLALAEAVDAGIIQRGHRVLLSGSGAGLSLGAVAITY